MQLLDLQLAAIPVLVSEGRFNIKTIFSYLGIPTIKVRLLWYRRSFAMEFVHLLTMASSYWIKPPDNILSPSVSTLSQLVFVYPVNKCLMLTKQSFPWVCRSVLGLCPLRRKTSYRQIAKSLEAARLGVIMTVSLWNSTGISTALLPKCLSKFRAIIKV